MLRALIFDVDGTLADTESAHLAAFNHAFAEAGLDWRWDEPLYTRLLEVAGGKERILHYWRATQPQMDEVPANVVQDTVDRLHRRKTAAYEAAVDRGDVSMRPGVLRLIDEALAQGLRLAIATTTTPANIAALLRRAIGADWRRGFAAIGDASNAPQKKPHPQVYLNVLAALQLPPADCLAFEDSGNGLRAARAAGLDAIVTPTRYTALHDFSDALRVLRDLGGVDVAQLRAWHGARAAPRRNAATPVARAPTPPLQRETPCP